MIREEVEIQTPSLPSPSSLLLARVRRVQKRLGRSTTISEQGSPIRSARPGWERVVWRVPEHLRAMSAMPKRATGPPWAALPVELDEHSSDGGVPKGGALFSDKGLNLSM